MEQHDIDVRPETLLTPAVSAEGHHGSIGTDAGRQVAQRHVESRSQRSAGVGTTIAETLCFHSRPQIEERRKRCRGHCDLNGVAAPVPDWSAGSVVNCSFL
jgi:hypothetical protein